MTIASISDLSQSLLLRRDNANLRRDLLSATRELATGQIEDRVSRFGGDFGPLAGIETALKRAESLLNNAGEQRLMYAAAQSALDTIREIGTRVSGPLVLVQEMSDSDLVRNAGRDALAQFETVVATLNTSVSGTTIFAGVESNGPALAKAATVLDSLMSEIAAAGASTSAEVVIVVDAWFAPGGGFDVSGYLGGARPTSGRPVSETAMAEPLVTASDPRVRGLLSSFALSALIGREVLDDAPDEQARLARTSGLRLLTADEGIVELMADVGTQENRTEQANTETLARRQALEIARADLTGVDPYDAATHLQATEAQLESLYAMTARLSRLSLAAYLR